MIVNSENLSFLLAGLNVDFEMAYNQIGDSPLVNRIATPVPTTLPVQRYGWLGAVPTMREFVDERQIRGVRDYEYTIADKVWESSIGIDRKAIEDDQYGVIRAKVSDLALEARQHRERLLVQRLVEGFTNTCYDGQYLFDTDHSEGNSGTQSNRTTSALSASTLQTAISTMMAIRNDQGQPMGIVPDLLVVGPKLRFIARELVESNVVVVKVGDGTAGSGATAATSSLNPINDGSLTYLVTPYLTGESDDYWFLFDTRRSVKAILFQERQDVPLEFAYMGDVNSSESLFKEDKIYAGIRARYNIGYGLWQTAYGAIL